MKRIVLCADDYGQAPAISNGILNLIKMGRLSATSCLVNMPNWTLAATDLAPFKDKIDVGLHFNLTEGQALSAEFINCYGPKFFSLSDLIKKSLLRRLDTDVLLAECLAQLTAFELATGYLPDYIDGHQHVHQFPVVRDAVLKAYEQRLKPTSAYIRLVTIPLTWGAIFTDRKKFIIHAMGTKALKEQLQTKNIPCNTTFSGIYDFRHSACYREHFLSFLAESEDGGLIMTHPGFPSDDKSDPIYFSRADEYNYFSSNQFLSDCSDYEVAISRLIEK